MNTAVKNCDAATANANQKALAAENAAALCEAATNSANDSAVNATSAALEANQSKNACNTATYEANNAKLACDEAVAGLPSVLQEMFEALGLSLVEGKLCTKVVRADG